LHLLERNDELEKEREEEEDDETTHSPPPFPPLALHPSILVFTIATLTNPLPIFTPHPSPSSIPIPFISDPVTTTEPPPTQRRGEERRAAPSSSEGRMQQDSIVKEEEETRKREDWWGGDGMRVREERDNEPSPETGKGGEGEEGMIMMVESLLLPTYEYWKESLRGEV
jgi:hypothetical protein